LQLLEKRELLTVAAEILADAPLAYWQLDDAGPTVACRSTRSASPTPTTI
jgi:hypothetical protein